MTQLPVHRVVLTVETPEGPRPQWVVDDLDQSEAYMLAMGLSNLLLSPEWPEFMYETKPYKPPSEEGELYYVIAEDGLRVRSRPDNNTEILFVLPHKAAVYVKRIVTCREGSKWANIDHGQWISADWIEKGEETQDEG